MRFIPVVFVGFCMVSAVAADGDTWRAAGGELLLELNTGVLEPLGIEVRAVDALEDQPPPAPQTYRRVRLAGVADSGLALQAPHYAIERFTGGRLAYRGGLVLTIGQNEVDLTGLTIRPRADHHAEFEIADAAGVAWLYLDHAHFELMDDGRALELRHMNLSMSQALAERVAVPGIAGQVLGRVHLRAPVVQAPEQTEPLGACSSPNWSTDPGFETDVTLVEMSSHFSLPPVHFFRCQGCNGSSGGPLVIAPNAKLANEGTADVPWYGQFSAPQPPYANDQHPYLIWNLYRQDADGALEQIAISGVKHAFFTVNTDCPCPGGNILWVGCTDTYSASDNDSATNMGPRGEIIPATGQWGRCHSFFDPGCVGSQTQSSTGGYTNRMQVMEAELDPAAHPDAQYFLEAWYVVRDDIEIYNTMGWRRITPTWNGSTWTFPVPGDQPFVQGPLVDTWVDPAAPGPGRMNTAVATPHGQLKVAVRTTDLGGGSWRYDYVVANFEFMRTTTAGAEPNLEVVDNTGVVGLRVPAGEDVTVTAIEFARADRMTGTDWVHERLATDIEWRDEAATPLDWGLLYRFSFVADAEPAESVLEILSGNGQPSVMVNTLAPSIPVPSLLHDRFEEL